MAGKNINYDNLIATAARLNGVDPALMKAMMHTESGFNPNARSPVGAHGLMQLMPATAKRFGVKDVWNPAENINGAARYLAVLNKQFGGDTNRVIAAYNAGEGNVRKYGGIPPFKETQDYVKKVMSRYGDYNGGSSSPTVSQRTANMLARLAIFDGRDFSVTSNFGGRNAPVAGASTNHNGIDLGAPKGTPIYAPEDGVLGGNQTSKGGNQLWVNGASGYRFGFAHLDKYAVQPGARVKKGQLIGYTGNSGIGTGAHLHFTVTDPRGQKIDPSRFTLQGGGQVAPQTPAGQFGSIDEALKHLQAQQPKGQYASIDEAIAAQQPVGNYGSIDEALSALQPTEQAGQFGSIEEALKHLNIS